MIWEHAKLGTKTWTFLFKDYLIQYEERKTWSLLFCWKPPSDDSSDMATEFIQGLKAQTGKLFTNTFFLQYLTQQYQVFWKPNRQTEKHKSILKEGI